MFSLPTASALHGPDRDYRREASHEVAAAALLPVGRDRLPLDALTVESVALAGLPWKALP